MVLCKNLIAYHSQVTLHSTVLLHLSEWQAQSCPQSRIDSHKL